MRLAFRFLLLIVVMFGVALVWWGSRPQTRPILVLAEGQSNMSNLLPYTWAPEKNLYVWNHFGQLQGTNGVGTTFMPAPTFMMNTAYAFANEIAKANPGVSVYVVNESYPSLDITHWLPGAQAPDMYAATSRNIGPAIARIGEPVELVHYWWQGESDFFRNNANYPADFLAHRARKKAESWYPGTTPIIVMGMSPYTSPGLSDYNAQVADAAAADGNAFFASLDDLPETLFDPVNGKIHLLAAGYEQAGKMAFRAWQTKQFERGFLRW